LLESLDEIVGDQAADALGLQVVGIVIAVRQHVGANHDAPLDLGAKALSPGLHVHIVKVAVVRGTVAVTHAVETAEIGTGLGRRDHVVGRHRQVRIGQ